jgi:hypothetical protein
MVPRHGTIEGTPWSYGSGLERIFTEPTSIPTPEWTIVKIMMWTDLMAMAVAIGALWALPVAVTLALFRPSHRRNAASCRHD